ncbi:MAG: hypothetical protein WBM87_13520 [Woeseiaceae bacterium]
MREHHPIIIVLALSICLALFSLQARADKLEGLDNTMQVLDDIDDLDKTAAYLRIPDVDDGEPDAAADEAADNASFDSDFEHDVGLEEELMQNEDDFEDGDDVDDDRISAPTATP